jgi:hypothetical protein
MNACDITNTFLDIAHVFVYANVFGEKVLDNSEYNFYPSKMYHPPLSEYFLLSFSEDYYDKLICQIRDRWQSKILYFMFSRFYSRQLRTSVENRIGDKYVQLQKVQSAALFHYSSSVLPHETLTNG